MQDHVDVLADALGELPKVLVVLGFHGASRSGQTGFDLPDRLPGPPVGNRVTLHAPLRGSGVLCCRVRAERVPMAAKKNNAATLGLPTGGII